MACATICSEGMSQLVKKLEGTNYRPIKLLGSGAMGEVYLAEHVRLRKQVVVKILLPHLGGNVEERFRLEAQALARLRHANIVEVLDCDVAGDGHPFLVMEHLEGEPLDLYLSSAGGHLPRQEALEVMRQTLGGLHAVHEAGFVHRDVKPSNLFRCADGRIKLLDFGVIKLAEAVTSIEPLEVQTREGMVVGTPKYMAPEQAAGKKVDRRTDVYAAAVVLYLLLTGRTPFEHHLGLADMLKAHVLEPPKPPSEVAPAGQHVQPGLDAAVLRALSKRPRDRFDTALAFAAALQSFDATYCELAAELGLDDITDDAPREARPSAPRAATAGAHVTPTTAPGRAPAPLPNPPAYGGASQPALPTMVLTDSGAPHSPAPAPVIVRSPPALRLDATEIGALLDATVSDQPPTPAWRDPIGRVLFVLAAFVSAIASAWVMR